MLQDSASDWSEGVARIHQGELDFQTWENFKKEFLWKYFPNSKRNKLENEFFNLKEGLKTVDEYETEFDRLSKCVTSLVLTDESRANMFAEGLANHIRPQLTGLNVTTYSDMVSRAKGIDSIWRETEGLRNQNQSQKKEF